MNKKSLLYTIFLLVLIIFTGISVKAQVPQGSGNTLTFSGNSYLNCGTGNRGILQQVTVEAWIKTNSSAYQWVLGKYSDSNGEDKGYHLVTNGGVASFNGRAGLQQYFSSGFSATRIDDNRWHHIAGVCNGDIWQIYVDGNLENSASYNYIGGNLTTTVPMAIGIYYVQNGQFFRGQIDEVRVWRTARTITDVRASMCSRFVTAPTDLVAYYRLDETIGSLAADIGSTPINAQFVGNFGSAPWIRSGAAIGDVSNYLYQSTWPSTTRVALGASSGDSAIINNISASTRGIHVYAINSAPLNSPGAGAANIYFGVFSTSSAVNSNYTLRVRSQNATVCSALYSRLSNDVLTWNLLSTTATSISLLALNQSYRAEYSVVRNTSLTTPRIVGDTLLCGNNSTSLNATTPGAVSYLWSNGATSPTITTSLPGTYSVTVGFGANCSSTASRTIVRTSLRVSGDSLVCVGGMAQLRANTLQSGNSYLWNNGATTATISVSQPGIYSVTVRYPNSCVLTATRLVQLFTPTVQIAGDTIVCTGNSIALTANGGLGVQSYRWNTGAITPAITVSQAGNYTVTAQFTNGCSASASYRVRQIPGVNAFTLGRDTTVCEDAPLLLQGPLGNGLRYLWSDGSTNQTLLVSRAGQYSLRVSGRCDFRTASISVTQQECLTIPNIITPNGDRANERFVIKGLTGQWKLEVYNRWGKCIYRIDQYANNWGEDVPAGVYYYLLQRNNSNSKYKGWLEVVR